ncbi:dienelactone hydrolase family protein [Vitiosangium sp. GDMCC 1.1324]|uniref:dienelactone hydrolase family protein n=1 Tax=Vitiosangium sp. (strain GDMCC 1.1324) TaxID=2138576 RepID=UPI000D3397B2|nr:dienelactone hydrolase family protein [Vitiosangium sp. GDMCC 1.1324]PTL83370.1 hydrolase [Vitiosangium sp. GDMCC 1.1324]
MAVEREVEVMAGQARLGGTLAVPEGARGLVIFAHGSGSSRHSPRNRYVAYSLRMAGLGTLLFDLLTEDEEALDEVTAELRFDIGFLAKRLAEVTDWVFANPELRQLNVGYFGSSTGAAAALVAAAERTDEIGAVVSRGGRPDLAGEALERVMAPTLFVVGGADDIVLDLNQRALERLRAPMRAMEVIPGATHLFPEPGALERVAELAAGWFRRFLVGLPLGQETRPSAP